MNRRNFFKKAAQLLATAAVTAAVATLISEQSISPSNAPNPLLAEGGPVDSSAPYLIGEGASGDYLVPAGFSKAALEYYTDALYFCNGGISSRLRVSIGEARRLAQMEAARSTFSARYYTTCAPIDESINFTAYDHARVGDIIHRNLEGLLSNDLTFLSNDLTRPGAWINMDVVSAKTLPFKIEGV